MGKFPTTCLSHSECMKTLKLKYDEYWQVLQHGDATDNKMRAKLLGEELHLKVANGELPSTDPGILSITQAHLDIIARIALAFTYPFWRFDPSCMLYNYRHFSICVTLITYSHTFDFAGK